MSIEAQAKVGTKDNEEVRRVVEVLGAELETLENHLSSLEISLEPIMKSREEKPSQVEQVDASYDCLLATELNQIRYRINRVKERVVVCEKDLRL